MRRIRTLQELRESADANDRAMVVGLLTWVAEVKGHDELVSSTWVIANEYWRRWVRYFLVEAERLGKFGSGVLPDAEAKAADAILAVLFSLPSSDADASDDL